MKTVIIDGWHLSNHMTGIDRYLIEILKELDLLLPGINYYLLIRKNYNSNIILNFKNIRILHYKTKNKLLRYFELFRIVRSYNSIYVNLTNGVPIGSESIVAIHDAHAFYNVKSTKRVINIIRRFKIYYSFLLAKRIVTVSEYSKNTLLDNLGRKYENKITIIPNAWQHIAAFKPDESVLKKYNLEREQYYYFVGGLGKNKNIEWIIREAVNNPESMFVISGVKIDESFTIYRAKNNNIIYTGMVSDEELTALYIHCKAFLFPSLMEGFGIPPMEALSLGKPIIISNTGALPEIYGKTAHYICPSIYDYDLNQLVKEYVEPPQELLKKYSWKKSAIDLYNLINRMETV